MSVLTKEQLKTRIAQVVRTGLSDTNSAEVRGLLIDIVDSLLGANDATSIQVTNSLESDGQGAFQLDNDLNAPGNLFHYGTNASGQKGWQMTPQRPTVSGSLEESLGVFRFKGDNSNPGVSKYYGTNASSQAGYYSLPVPYAPEMSIQLNGNLLRLVNDLNAPGSNMVYGTSGTGVKGWIVPINNDTDLVVISLDQEALRGQSDSVFELRADLPVLLPNYAGRIVAAKCWFKTTYTGGVKPVLKLHFGDPILAATNDLTVVNDATMYDFVMTGNNNFTPMSFVDLSCAGGGNLDSGVGVVYLFVERT